jgi:iron complex transport system ATP-binding protein
MIELRNIVCGYGRKVVLSEVNLMIETGKLTCLMGQNGAGKTTLFKTLLGLLPPLEGAVFIDRKPISALSHKDMAMSISYVPQAHGTPFLFTVFEVVLMGQYAYAEGMFKLPSKKNRQVASESIGLLGIDHLKANYFSDLSGGEKQLVLIARALAQQPRFIAMDEPTSNLDLGNQVKVMKIAQLLKDEGYGVIMNTHNPDHALNFSDHVVLLKNGKIRESGNPKEVIDSTLITEIYGTPIELVTTHTMGGDQRRVCLAV